MWQEYVDNYRIYAKILSISQVQNQLPELRRYGLVNYIPKKQKNSPTEAEQRQLNDLSNAGRRLMGFSRTNLFKRLESSGMAFIQSLERHILRNFVYLYAIENNLEIPIGTQNADLLDTRNSDEDSDSVVATEFDTEIEEGDNTDLEPEDPSLRSEKTFRERAKVVYQEYQTRNKRRFKWLRSTLFDTQKLTRDLLSDAQTLIQVLENSGKWETQQDEKLGALVELLTKTHPHDKVLIFTQFADTVRYLTDNLQGNIASVAGVTGQSQDPTELAGRFSPVSNGKRDKIPPEKELRILIATDVLSEGHNLQDCAIIVNYDLPWAIIRLIQRAGRVDRIGQKADKILCYSFLPAEGVERIINLRGRLRQRLQENADVVGTDERFFEDEQSHVLLDLYNEKSGALDEEEDTEVDLTSEAFQIWKKATENNPALKKMIEEMPNVVYSTRAHVPTPVVPEGVLLYMKTAEGNDSLILVDRQGNSVTQSQLGVLRAAVCEESTPAIPRDEQHHELVSKGAELLALEETNSGGQLGRHSGARYRTYERLKSYANENRGTLFVTEELLKAIEQIYHNPLRQSAIDTLNRQLKSGISNGQLAEWVVGLRRDECLCRISEEAEKQEPVIICSLGLFKEK
jgi:superfamily II DNA/RNA helicase